MKKKIITKCVYIPIIGKTNTGKSTLFNKLIKKKISITSKKKNTTQKRIIGINTNKNNQYIYIDNPGFFPYQSPNKYIQNIIYFLKNFFLIKKINLFIFIIGLSINLYEIELIKIFKKKKINILLLINKIDKLKNKLILLPYIKKINNINNKYISIIPICIKKKKHIKNLINKFIKNFMIISKHFYKKNIITNCNNEFIISEIIREKTIRLLGDEIPYFLNFKTKKIIHINNIYKIECIIFFKKKQYNKIIIGFNGNKIKKIIKLSIRSIKKYLNTEKNIFLNISLKLKKNITLISSN